MEKKLKKKQNYLTYCNLSIVQGLWQALKEFIILNVNTSTAITNVKLAELHAKYVTVFLNTELLKMI